MRAMLVQTWATMDPHELQAIHYYTLHGGIRDAADEIERLREENEQLLSFIAETPCECFDDYGMNRGHDCDRCRLLRGVKHEQ